MISATKVVILLLLLGGCATKPQLVVSDYCENATIIRPSRQDTPGTLRQIASNNAKYRGVCGEPDAPGQK